MILIGLAGVAGAGKDFFASFAVDYFRKKNKTVHRFALADEVKMQIDPFIQENFGFSCFTSNRELKEQVRPTIINFAETKKEVYGQDYWVKVLANKLKEYDFVEIGIITDIRFPVEVAWLKQTKGSLIHITRFNYRDDNTYQLKEPVLPKNDFEKQNDPFLIQNCDLKFIWPELTNEDAAFQVEQFLTESKFIWNKHSLVF